MLYKILIPVPLIVILAFTTANQLTENYNEKSIEKTILIGKTLNEYEKENKDRNIKQAQKEIKYEINKNGIDDKHSVITPINNENKIKVSIWMSDIDNNKVEETYIVDLE